MMASAGQVYVEENSGRKKDTFVWLLREDT